MILELNIFYSLCNIKIDTRKLNKVEMYDKSLYLVRSYLQKNYS